MKDRQSRTLINRREGDRMAAESVLRAAVNVWAAEGDPGEYVRGMACRQAYGKGVSQGTIDEILTGAGMGRTQSSEEQT